MRVRLAAILMLVTGLALVAVGSGAAKQDPAAANGPLIV
jgi:hypothetical protein